MLWLTGAALLFIVVATVGIRRALEEIQPMVRRRVVAALAERFHSPVELDRLNLSMRGGVLVEGGGLRILYLAGPPAQGAPHAVPNPAAPVTSAPMLSVDRFDFRTGWRELLRPTTHLVSVDVQGLRLNVPPKEFRAAADATERKPAPWRFVVDTFVCKDATVTLETSNPEKKPLVFQIQNLKLTDVGADRPFKYEATLINPKPVGDVASSGTFGPWQRASPRDTPLAGTYSFTHADLSSIHGIGGVLASTGRFDGTLGTIATQGVAEVPEFKLDVSDHSLPLHVEYRAMVDGTTGDTHLSDVKARLGRSYFTAAGAVTRAEDGTGHNTDLNVVMDKGRLEDILTLVLKANPPLLRGNLALKEHIVIPPGPVSVSRKMRVDGTFAVTDAIFNNPAMQQKIDTMSMRAQGKPKLANVQDAAVVGSAVSGEVSIHDAVVHLPSLIYTMPGGELRLNGEVALVPSSFEFHGTIRTQATASQMTTGWKSALLSPFDKLLKKNGAGLELPIHVTGAHSTYEFSLDFPHSTQPPARVTGMPRTMPQQ